MFLLNHCWISASGGFFYPHIPHTHTRTHAHTILDEKCTSCAPIKALRFSLFLPAQVLAEPTSWDDVEGRSLSRNSVQRFSRYASLVESEHCVRTFRVCVPGVAHGKQLSMYEIASIMREPVEDAGSCGRGCCVEIERKDGTTENRLLQIDQSVSPEDDGCVRYTCKVNLDTYSYGSIYDSYL